MIFNAEAEKIGCRRGRRTLSKRVKEEFNIGKKYFKTVFGYENAAKTRRRKEVTAKGTSNPRKLVSCVTCSYTRETHPSSFSRFLKNHLVRRQVHLEAPLARRHRRRRPDPPRPPPKDAAQTENHRKKDRPRNGRSAAPMTNWEARGGCAPPKFHFLCFIFFIILDSVLIPDQCNAERRKRDNP